jgi:hypothetical protein
MVDSFNGCLLIARTATNRFSMVLVPSHQQTQQHNGWGFSGRHCILSMKIVYRSVPLQTLVRLWNAEVLKCIEQTNLGGSNSVD